MNSKCLFYCLKQNNRNKKTFTFYFIFVVVWMEFEYDNYNTVLHALVNLVFIYNLFKLKLV